MLDGITPEALDVAKAQTAAAYEVAKAFAPKAQAARDAVRVWDAYLPALATTPDNAKRCQELAARVLERCKVEAAAAFAIYQEKQAVVDRLWCALQTWNKYRPEHNVTPDEADAAKVAAEAVLAGIHPQAEAAWMTWAAKVEAEQKLTNQGK